MAFCKLLPALVLLLHTQGVLGAEVRGAIIGGNDAQKDSWPWMVHVNISSEDERNWRCGGTILNEKWVLTAGSCWDPKLKAVHKLSHISVGDYQLTKDFARYMGIETVKVHDHYEDLGGFYKNNIALIRLKKKIDFSKYGAKVSLPKDDDIFGSSSECWITGWGETGNGIPLPAPETLQEAKVSITDQVGCQTTYPQLTSDMLCAGAQGQDACKGDYGGPLVCRKGSKFVQVGIMSYGSCSLRGRPSIYTRVSKYLHFINSFIHKY
ncbi:tryptase-like [Pholidichthys leucotaenia]